MSGQNTTHNDVTVKCIFLDMTDVSHVLALVPGPTTMHGTALLAANVQWQYIYVQ